MGDEMRAGWRKLPTQFEGREQYTCRGDDNDCAVGVVFWGGSFANRFYGWCAFHTVNSNHFGDDLTAAQMRAETLLRESVVEPGASATCKLCGHRGAYPSVVALFPDAELLDAGGPDRVLRCCDAEACAGRRESGGEVAANTLPTDRAQAANGSSLVCRGCGMTVAAPHSWQECTADLRRERDRAIGDYAASERDLREVRAAHQACAASLAEALRERDARAAEAQEERHGRLAAAIRADDAEAERDKLTALLDGGADLRRAHDIVAREKNQHRARADKREAERDIANARADAAEWEVERLRGALRVECEQSRWLRVLLQRPGYASPASKLAHLQRDEARDELYEALEWTGATPPAHGDEVREAARELVEALQGTTGQPVRVHDAAARLLSAIEQPARAGEGE